MRSLAEMRVHSKDDYTKKKIYYLNIEVPEYWIVDLIPKGSGSLQTVS